MQAERQLDFATARTVRGVPFEQVGAFLRLHSLDPLPPHYEIAYDYLTGSDPDLTLRVDNAVREYGTLNAVAMAGIMAVRNAALSAAELARAAAEAHEQLRRISNIVDRSGQDVRDYGSTLEQMADGPSAEAMENLIDVTRAMIEKARCAEEDLRRSGQEVSQLRESLADARRKAETDPLTGLPNRRALDTRLRAAFDAARSAGTPLSVAICDIDRFKLINDTHGHQIGDEVIKFVATSLSRSTPEGRFVARFGGEEFVMLFEGLAPEAAAEELDRVRVAIAARNFKVTATGRQLGHVSFSAGIAGIATGKKNPAATLKLADAALYRAKQEGRNRISVAP